MTGKGWRMIGIRIVYYCLTDDIMEIIRTFDDGTVVKLHRKTIYSVKYSYTSRSALRRGYDGWVTRVETPCGRRFEFSDRQQALLWGALWARTGGTRFVTDRDLLPYNVAALGKTAIAVYISVVHPLSLSEVGEILGVSKKTVVQYRSDFLDGRR